MRYAPDNLVMQHLLEKWATIIVEWSLVVWLIKESNKQKLVYSKWSQKLLGPKTEAAYNDSQS